MEKEVQMLDDRQKKEKELIEAGAHVCINCAHWRRAKPEDDDGECRESPMKPFVFPAKGPLGQPTFIVNCFFPRSRPDIDCGKFTLKAPVMVQ